MLKFQLLGLLFTVFNICLFSQNAELDSLKLLIEKTTDKKIKSDLFYIMSSKSKGKDDSLCLYAANQAIQFAKATNYIYGLGEGHRAKGNFLYFKGEYQEAKSAYQEAKGYFEKIGVKKKISATFNDLGLMNRYLGNTEKALELFTQSIAIDKETKDTASLAASYTNVVMILMDESKLEEAIEHLHYILLLDSLKGDWIYYSQDLGNIAVTYKKANQYDKALTYALRGYVFADSIGDISGSYQQAGIIGDIYHFLGNNESALEYLDKSLVNAKKYGKANIISNAYARFQLIYSDMDSIDLSLSYFDSALLYAPPIYKPPLYNNIGELYEEKLNDFNLAAVYYDKSIKEARNIAKLDLEVDPLLNRGFLYKKSLKFNEAKAYIAKGLGIANQIKKPITANVLGEAAEIYYLANDYKSSYNVLRNAFVLQDSLLSIEQNAQLQLLSYEKQIRDLEIREQAYKIKENEQKLKERFYMMSILGFLVLSALLIGYIIYSKNQKLLLLNKKLEYLTNEIHHRVKNDFQSIASMIFIQLNQIEDDKVKKALSGVRNRILAMGQIHMLFYKEGDYFGMGIGSYLKKLVESRTKALSNEYLKADLTIDININKKIEQRITFDEAKQLGVVINEIITNAFKHAFQGNESPLLVFNADVNQGKELAIQIDDNGKGITIEQHLGQENSFGLKMIELLCRQLEWELSYKNMRKGTRFIIKIPTKI